VIDVVVEVLVEVFGNNVSFCIHFNEGPKQRRLSGVLTEQF
jgi:hypothetical protein